MVPVLATLRARQLTEQHPDEGVELFQVRVGERHDLTEEAVEVSERHELSPEVLLLRGPVVAFLAEPLEAVDAGVKPGVEFGVVGDLLVGGELEENRREVVDLRRGPHL